MKRSDESAPRTDGLELEPPDGSGMDDSLARVDPDAAFLLREEYPVWFEEAAARWRIQRSEKCVVEFVL